MRLFKTVLPFILLSFVAMGQSNIQLDSKIKKVTVFMQGAQIERESSTSIGAGTTELIIGKLEAGIDPNSIQVEGSGDYTIMEVKHDQRYVEGDAVIRSPYYRKLIRTEDSLRNQNWILELANEYLKSLESERNLLYTNPIATGQSIDDSLDLLIDAIDFFREQLAITNRHLIEAKKDVYEEKKITDGINARLRKLRLLNQSWESKNGSVRYANEIHVIVDAGKAQSLSISVTYQLKNAGWSPVYDLKSESLNQAIAITYKASVWQNTGKDWSAVTMELATHRPSASQQKPEAPEWRITDGEMVIYNSNKNKQSAYAEESTIIYEKYLIAKAETADRYVEQNDGLTYRSYKINKKYNIPSDAKQHVIEIQNTTLEVQYAYKAVPYQQTDAYLIASLDEWENLNLLKGKANIYLEGKYVGVWQLDPSTFKDTLDISFGRDARIQVKRELDKQSERKPAFGNYITNERNYVYSVNNKTNTEINLVVEDRYPTTKLEYVEITLKPGNEKYLWNPKTGAISWALKIKAQERTDFKAGFAVKYPKDKPVNGL
ncbi:MAG: hypothetical protein ACI8P7_001197 [Candidatus Azotimanducaceae bacterium]|jgi:uncharacterized protein (TIGR02231 family)